MACQPINKQMTGSICDSAEVVEEAKLPCPAGFRTFRLKENNRCSFKKKQRQTPNIILLHKFMPVNIWRIRTFLPALTGCLEDSTKKGLHISNLYHISMMNSRECETLPWYVPQRSFQGLLWVYLEPGGNRGLGFPFPTQGDLIK